MLKTILYFAVFMTIWWSGCYLADYVFLFESRAWTMAYGFAVGSLAFIAGMLASK